MRQTIMCTILGLSSIWAVSSMAQTRTLTTGEPIPVLELTGADGQTINLRDAAKEKPLVLIFYRGGWCPYCNTHLGQLQEIDPQLRELGYRIVAISPDRPENLGQSIDKGNLTYTLLSDSSAAAAKAFGLAFTVDDATLEKYAGYGIDLEAASGEKHHMLPVPAVFLVGRDGIIDFVYINPDYKTRIASEVLLDAAKANVEDHQK